MKHFLLIIAEVALVGYASPPIFCRRKKWRVSTGGSQWGGYDASGSITKKTTSKYDQKGNKVAWWTYELKAGFGEKRLVSIEEETWEYTYWD